MKRPDGAGTKDRLPSGKVRVRIRVEGNRKAYLFPNEEQADRFLRGIRDLATTGDLEIGVPRLGPWGAAWLDRRTTVSASKERGVWRHHVEGTSLADLPVREVRARHLRAWAEQELPRHRVLVQSLGGERVESPEPISIKTRKHCVALVRVVLQAAVEADLIQVSPFGLQKGGLRFRWTDEDLGDEDLRHLEEQQVVQLLGCQALPVAARLHYGWALGSGARQGESWALRWGNLDLQAQRAEIRRSGGRKTTKGGKVRAFALLPLAVESLLRWRELAPDTRPDALVWPARMLPPRPGGTRWRIAADRILRRRGEGDDFGWADRSRGAQGVQVGHRAKAGLPEGLTYHALRHTACAGLLRGYAILGVTRRWSLDEVCDWIGHSSRQVTEIYAHIVGGGLGDQAVLQSAAGGSRLGHVLPPHLSVSPSAPAAGLEPATRRLTASVTSAPDKADQGFHDPRVTHASAEAADLAREILQILGSGDPHAVRRVIERAAEVLDQAKALPRAETGITSAAQALEAAAGR